MSLLLITAVAWFPGQVVGEYRIVLRQFEILNEFPHLLPSEVHWCAGPQRLVDMQAERLAAAQEVEQVLGFKRIMFDEYTHRVEVHGFDASQVSLDDLGVIRAATQPRFEVVAVSQANPAGGHVVHAMRLPRPAAQPEPAVARLDELRLRLGCPHAQLMAQPINRRPAQSQTNRNAGILDTSGKATLLHRLRLAGRERNPGIEYRLFRGCHVL